MIWLHGGRAASGLHYIWGQTNLPSWRGALAAFLFLSAGPVIAAAGLILGWISFLLFRAPKTGIRLVFFPPVAWVVAVLAYFALIMSVCDGSFTCGASL